MARLRRLQAVDEATLAQDADARRYREDIVELVTYEDDGQSLFDELGDQFRIMRAIGRRQDEYRGELPRPRPGRRKLARRPHQIKHRRVTLGVPPDDSGKVP